MAPHVKPVITGAAPAVLRTDVSSDGHILNNGAGGVGSSHYPVLRIGVADVPDDGDTLKRARLLLVERDTTTATLVAVVVSYGNAVRALFDKDAVICGHIDNIVIDDNIVGTSIYVDTPGARASNYRTLHHAITT